MLLNFLDVEKVIKGKTSHKTNFPDGVNRIFVYGDAIEVTLSEFSYVNSFLSIAEGWFNQEIDRNNPSIKLDVGDEVIPIEFEVDIKRDRENIVYPLWNKIIYHSEDSNGYLPEPDELDIDISTFHSIEHTNDTINLLYTVKNSLIRRGKKVLIVNSDISDCFDTSIGYNSDVSLLSLIDSFHYGYEDKVISYFSDRLTMTSENGCYELPLYNNINELIDIQVTPENMTKCLYDVWRFSRLIQMLGKSLRVDHILIYTGFGFSEFTAPLLLNNKFNRVFVCDNTSTGIKLTNKMFSLLQMALNLQDEPANSKVRAIYFYNEEYEGDEQIEITITRDNTDKNKFELLIYIYNFNSYSNIDVNLLIS